MTEEINGENRGTLNPTDAKKAKKKRRATPRQAAAGRGNLVAFKETNPAPALKHGVRAFIQSNGAELPAVPYAAEVRQSVAAMIDTAIVDLGGPEHVTAMQRHILESSRVALTVVALGARYLSDQGIVNKKGRPHGLLSILGTYLNAVRLNAVELGLQRQARPAGASSLAEYLEIRSQESEPNSQAETTSEAQSASE